MYQNNTYTLSLSLKKNLDYSAPIMFLPSYVKTQTNTQGISTLPKKNNPLTQSVAQKTITKPKAAEPKKTTIAPTIKKVPVEEKKEIKPEIKQETSAKTLPETQQKEPIVKAPPAKIIDTQQVAAAPVIQTPTKSTQPPAIPENAQTSDNYREVEAMRRTAQLQKELVQKWKPPIGVSPECTCDVTFFVNKAGSLENVKIIKSSGVVMYDISARQALYTMKMPQWTHGKQINITFKQ